MFIVVRKQLWIRIITIVGIALSFNGLTAHRGFPWEGMFPSKDTIWLTQECIRQLRGCQATAEDGTVLYTPDSRGNFAAIWTRDFSYMVENAGDLIPHFQIRDAILYLLKGQRSDGCIPERVQRDGRAVYSAGPLDHPLGDVPTDNSQFMVKLVADYIRLSGDFKFFNQVYRKLDRAMSFTPRSPEGLVYIRPGHRQSPNGFTDTVAMSGNLLFSSLLYWEACGLIARLHEKAGRLENSAEYRYRAKLIEKNLDTLFDEVTGLYFAASIDCRQIDIWGNAYSLYLSFPTPHAERIRHSLLANLERYTWHGLVRHLRKGEYWQKLLIDVKRDTYQNGAYWGMASGWVIAAITPIDAKRARTLFSEVLKFYHKKGSPECAGPGYLRLPDYLASAVNVRAVAHP